MAVHLRLAETIGDAEVIAATGSPQTTPGGLCWDFDLASGESRRLTYLLRLPDSTEGATLTSTLSRELSGTWQECGTETLQVFAANTGPELLCAATDEASALVVSGSSDSHHKAKIASILSDISRHPPRGWGGCERTITDLLKALRELRKIDSTDTVAAHLALDKVLTYYEAKWSK